jgi:hypothetical protein
MSEDKVTIRGITYVSHSALTFGDYGGAGSVGLANIRTLMAEHPDSAEVHMSNLDNHCFHDGDWALNIERHRPGLLVAFGSHGGQQAWLREDLADDTLRALADYPSLDDEEISRVEMEWLEEALDSYLLRFDIPNALRDMDEALEDKWSKLSGEDRRRTFYEAMEDAGVHPEPEYGGVYVDAEKIARHMRFDPANA